MSDVRLPGVGERTGSDGRYRLVRLLGRGGMGTVFEAVNERIGKRVALKILDPDLKRSGDDAARLVQEARVAAAVGHRGIVQVFDVDTTAEGDDGLPFLVMELLEGRTFKELIDEGAPLDVPTVARIACHVLSALSAAHEEGVVHRDLKPSNIFLVESGAAAPEVKLLDFGISRLMRHGFMDRRTVTIPVTQTGVVLGTPQFMSPEQARGQRDVDHRTDLFSLGTVIYLALCGEMPFAGENYNALIAAIMTDDPVDPTVRRSDLPPALERAILRALAKDRDERFQSAADMFVRLLPFVSEGDRDTIPPAVGPVSRRSEPPEVSEPPPGKRPAWALWAGLAGAAALVPLVLFFGSPPDRPPAAEPSQVINADDPLAPVEATSAPDAGGVAPDGGDGGTPEASITDASRGPDAHPRPVKRAVPARSRTKAPTKGGIFSDSPYE